MPMPLLRLGAATLLASARRIGVNSAQIVHSNTSIGSIHKLNVLTKCDLSFKSQCRSTFRDVHNVQWMGFATATNTTDRISRLRVLMQSPEYNVNAFVIPAEDAHQSEYVAECDERRSYISGFTGSAGLAIVSLDSAALFTDGRYFLQASQQLDSNWTLMKSGLPNVPTWQEYLEKSIPPGSRIGIDPLVFTAADAASLEKKLSKSGSSLVSIPNLVDLIWKERPSRPAKNLSILSTKTTGKTHIEKIADLRHELTKNDVAGFVVSSLDEIAWLFNMRGSDVHCNPVFFGYAVVTQEFVNLYLQEKSVTKEVRDHLGSIVQIKPYDAIYEDLQIFSRSNSQGNDRQKILLGTRTNLALQAALGKENTVEMMSPVAYAKAIKNDAELDGIRQCHLRDAAAVINYFAWLENQLQEGSQVDEVDGANQLQKFREEQKGFVGLSFDTISSTGANGAIIHYKPEKPVASVIDPKLVYLCDSGGQYQDGTTDITRTLHFQTPTAFEKHCFTRVLQGHIAIDSAIFPEGTTGYNLDILSRRALWSDGLDFRHGTGHGVGAFLNVHEGPHGCGPRLAYNEVPLVPGMTLTNEPGYYEDGKFGIRIENVLLVRKAETKHKFGGKDYYGFEHVTFVPIQSKMIEKPLLSKSEVDWINRYHEECIKKVSPYLAKDSLGFQWLMKETVPI
ncbi:hypothetical protein BGZ76_001424 [Entomortierella beljakovae]|nr:hypothetical protein BGZ76_001424 [Entomortierella beljakovae]